jgi:hypothetical protein
MTSHRYTRRTDGTWNRRTSGDAEAASMSFYEAITGSDYATKSAPGGAAGTATDFFAAQVLRWPSLAVGSATRSSHTRRSGSSGYVGRTTGALAALGGFAFDGSAGAVSLPDYTIQPADEAVVMMQVMVFTGGQFRHYVNRSKVGADAAMVGHTPGASVPVGFGIRGDVLSEPATNTQLHGIAQGSLSLGADAAAVLATVQAWFDAVKAAGHLVACPGVDTPFVRYVDDTGAFAGTGDALTITGSPDLVTIDSPDWGW